MLSVNLTTTSSRLDLCSATVWSIVNQSTLPDYINIWISKDPYLSDKGIHLIPVWVDEINKLKNIVRIIYTENIGPYRKVIPALRLADINDLVVYADDDVVYGKYWLESLVDLYYKYDGKKIIASRLRLKEKNYFGKYKGYMSYKLCKEEITFKSDFIITGVGGCLLNKSHINNDLLMNNDFLIIAPKTDDIWISKLIEISGTSVVSCPNALNEVNEVLHYINSLNMENINHISTGGFLYKIYHKIVNKIGTNFGFCVTNNDRAIFKVNEYFTKKYL